MASKEGIFEVSKLLQSLFWNFLNRLYFIKIFLCLRGRFRLKAENFPVCKAISESKARNLNLFDLKTSRVSL